jgi:hypothetical protein
MDTDAATVNHSPAAPKSDEGESPKENSLGRRLVLA